MVLELGLSEGSFFLEVLLFCQKKFLDSLVFEFVEIVFILLKFPVEFELLYFGFFDLISKFFDLRTLECELLFDIFLFLNFLAIVFKLGFEVINLGDKLGFFIVA